MKPARKKQRELTANTGKATQLQRLNGLNGKVSGDIRNMLAGVDDNVTERDYDTADQ